MAYEVNRLEIFSGEVFFNMEINDDLGFYNFGKWLNAEECILVREDEANINAIAEGYLVEARTNKEADLQAQHIDAKH